MSRGIAIGLLATLACRPAEKAPEPPPAPANVEQAVWRALGTEPFWHLDLSVEGLRFTTPDDTLGIVTPPVKPRSEGDTTRWTGATERTAFDVRIWPGSCSDGMSDRIWPAVALVQIDGRTWRGWAEKVPENHLGSWRVTGHRAPGISAMTPEDAAAIVRGPDRMYTLWDGVFFELEREEGRLFPDRQFRNVKVEPVIHPKADDPVGFHV